jgi:hypothetical protein
MPIITINGKPVSRAHQLQLVSRTAILILSAVLIGTTIGRASLSGIYMYAFSAGIIGMISFFALDIAAHRKSRQVARKTIEVWQERLAARIERHVPRQRLPAETLRLHRRLRRLTSSRPIARNWS